MPLDCKVRSTTPELVLFIRGHGVLDIKDIDEFSTFFSTHLNGDKPFKVFFDLRNVETAPMRAITSMASYMTSYEILAQEKVIATAVLVGGYTIESLLNILFTFKQPTTPTKVTSSLEEACNYLNGFESVIEREN